jgi:hypothetical protein
MSMASESIGACEEGRIGSGNDATVRWGKAKLEAGVKLNLPFSIQTAWLGDILLCLLALHISK